MIGWIASIALGVLVGVWVILYQPGSYRGRHRAPEQKRRR